MLTALRLIKRMALACYNRGLIAISPAKYAKSIGVNLGSPVFFTALILACLAQSLG